MNERGTHRELESQLFELASIFRAAILACDRGKLLITFRDFPHGACGDAALLLARFFDDYGISRCTYVYGWRETSSIRGSHAWLEHRGFIVDITGDQFETRPPVVVTMDRMWYVQFVPSDSNDADLAFYDAHTRSNLEHAFRYIIESIRVDSRTGDQMTEPAKATAPYGDFHGTIAIDGFDGLTVFDLIESHQIPQGYWPIGLRIHGSNHRDKLPKLRAKVLCVDIDQVGKGQDAVAKYCRENTELHTFEFEAEIDLEKLVRKLKRLDVILLSRITRGADVRIQHTQD